MSKRSKMNADYAKVANRLFDNQLHAFPLNPAQLDAHLYWHAGSDEDPTNQWLRTQLIQAVQRELNTP